MSTKVVKVSARKHSYALYESRGVPAKYDVVKDGMVVAHIRASGSGWSVGLPEGAAFDERKVLAQELFNVRRSFASVKAFALDYFK
jgi:hypothetical protein